jgi:succinyl-diaminopimelate desuccinylase
VRIKASAVPLTQALVRQNSINPPGNEEACATLLARELDMAGLAVRLHHFGDRRVNLVAAWEGSDPDALPLVLTGHLDTVPLGDAPWSKDPFGGEIMNGRMFGRGVSDMKAGVAAMAVAAMAAAKRGKLRRGLRLVFTGGEETGCEGALALREEGLLHGASGIVIGEPSANRMALGHKGCLCIKARASGITAHSSMPHLGRNAIYRVAEAVLAARDLDLSSASSALGQASVNVGLVGGGLNFNSVPDAAWFTVDVRSNDAISHDCLHARLTTQLGSDITLERLIDMPALLADRNDPFVEAVAGALEAVRGSGGGEPRIPLPFFTDGSVLAPSMNATAVILGPGEPDCAHQTDEWCEVARIEEAVAIYGTIIDAWCT